MKYKVVWVSRQYLYGESSVEANSLEEAELKAQAGEDTNFERHDPYRYRDIESIERIED